MVILTNIKAENGYITAHALNDLNNVEEDIMAKMDGTQHSSKDNDIVKATWSVVAEYKIKGSLPKKTAVAWG